MSSIDRSIAPADAAADPPAPPSYVSARSAAHPSAEAQSEESSPNTPPDDPPPSYEEAVGEHTRTTTAANHFRRNTRGYETTRRVEHYTSSDGRVTSTSTFLPDSNRGMQIGTISSGNFSFTSSGMPAADAVTGIPATANDDAVSSVHRTRYTSPGGRVTSVNAFPANNGGIQVGSIGGGGGFERPATTTTTGAVPPPTSSTTGTASNGDADGVRRIVYTSPDGHITSVNNFRPGSNRGIQAAIIGDVTWDGSTFTFTQRRGGDR
ncbi:hypothetical protein LTR85_008798 [Meristemomyces frigidus]|nr:hypothetical protein LTR85_008798 [Meristemomyces frigidus]